MDEYEKSGIASPKDLKRFVLSPDPSTVTVMDSANIGGGVETGSTGERDMHSDATSEKHSTPLAHNQVTKQEDSIVSSSSASGIGIRRESGVSLPRTAVDDVVDGDGQGGLYGTDSTLSSSQPKSASHASDFHSAEGLASDMPDRKGIRKPASSGDRATDITGLPYIQ